MTVARSPTDRPTDRRLTCHPCNGVSIMMSCHTVTRNGGGREGRSKNDKGNFFQSDSRNPATTRPRSRRACAEMRVCCCCICHPSSLPAGCLAACLAFHVDPTLLSLPPPLSYLSIISSFSVSARVAAAAPFALSASVLNLFIIERRCCSRGRGAREREGGREQMPIDADEAARREGQETDGLAGTNGQTIAMRCE